MFIAIAVDDVPDGYPRLAALIDSDINTRIYRRFGYYRNRLLLHRQDELAEITRKLDSLDKADEFSCPERLYSRRDDEMEGDTCARLQLLQQLDVKMKDYDELLMREHAIASLTRPTRRDHLSYFNWVYNNKPVVREEYEFIYHRDDFVLIGNQEDAWLGCFVETMWAILPPWLLKVSFFTNPTPFISLIQISACLHLQGRQS
jgi:transglutaminase-like putative cysteine protease